MAAANGNHKSGSSSSNNSHSVKPMTANSVSVHMLKSLCGNLKMAFDLAKVHFLEAQVTVQDFKKLQMKIEDYEANPEDGVDIQRLRSLIEGVKDSVANLRSKLVRNWTLAEDGYKMLQERLKMAEDMLEHLFSTKRKYEDGYTAYKRLRTSEKPTQSAHTSRMIAERKRKLEYYTNAIAMSEPSIQCIRVERSALMDACEKMDEFLQETKTFVDRLHGDYAVSAEANKLYSWCLQTHSDEMMTLQVQMHDIDDNSLAFEIPNPNNSSMNSPRLVLIVTFQRQEHGRHPYSITFAKVNLESMNIYSALEKAIQTNDLTSLLTATCEAWERKFPLLDEIASLRERYPVDWQEKTSQLCVLLGSQNKVSWTLVIPPAYPTGSGKISLKETDTPSDNSNLKPCCSNPNLTTWVDHLAEIFQHS